MYAEIGNERCQVKFTRKELRRWIAAVVTIAGAVAGYVMRLEAKLATCEARIERVERAANEKPEVNPMPGPPSIGKACGPPCVAPDWTRKVAQ